MNLDLKDILWEDEDILVIRKHAGVPVQHSRAGQMDLEHLLLNYLALKKSQKKTIPYLAVIHRLDQPVEGILVFAKNSDSARKLNAQLAVGRIKKEYLAVTDHEPEKLEGTLDNYLVKCKGDNRSVVTQKDVPGAKRSILSYKTLEKDKKSEKVLLLIFLKTGRHHQIRVQMAHAKMPLCGDRKYNKEYKDGENLALCAYKLTFFHPVTNKELKFQVSPENIVFHPFLGKLRE
ncbi:RNA pseudouridine synthase [Blautia liquoris]|uniref:RNA pseudouridylate synthase n=1 Tax=Blautia liquoris TaxID=2779518 RepID=A0A7M2RHQ4_9FIRM|nr:RNA pseudouridine synthase [Blautia liquoris]QOV19514.1 RNA pseudouridine synthase [Blautia liquoris]